MSNLNPPVQHFEWSLLASAAHYDLTDIAERKRSNKDLVSLFYALVDSIKPKLFLEIGAFRADVSLQIKRKHPSARVVAFEANPHNFANFTERVDYGKQGVEYLHLAVSSAPGEVTFSVIKEWKGKPISPRTGRNSLLDRKDDTVKYEKVAVEAVSLDHFFADFEGGGAALWVDVEGAVGLALKGGQEFLKNAELIFVEVEETPFWEGQWLASDVVRELSRYGLIPIARDFESPTGRQYNLLFAQPSRLSDPAAKAAMIDYVSRCSHPASYEKAKVAPNRAVAESPET